MSNKQENQKTIVIKKYANRRLYNTASSSYVTLETLCTMVKQGQDFVVYDAKSGDDITRAVLTQIIVEEESKGGQNLLPIRFLKQLISYYGEGLPQSVLPNYLEIAMENFTQNQEKLTSYMSENLGSVFPFGNIEEISRQNMAMFDQAMKMFTPFGNPPFGNPFSPHGVPSSAATEDQKEDQSQTEDKPSPAGSVSDAETQHNLTQVVDVTTKMQQQTELMFQQMQNQMMAMQQKINEMEEIKSDHTDKS